MGQVLDILFDLNFTCIVLLVIGFLCCILEVLTIGFGIFGVFAIALFMIAFIIKIIIGSSIIPLLYVIAISLLVFLLICVVGIKSARFGGIVKSSWIQSTNPNSSFKQQYSDLINKVGIVISDCRPVGKMKILDKEFDVISEGLFIKRNVQVKVVKIEDNLIYVKELSK